MAHLDLMLALVARQLDAYNARDVEAFTADARTALQVLASHLAVAIEKARSFERERRQAEEERETLDQRQVEARLSEQRSLLATLPESTFFSRYRRTFVSE